MDVLFEILKVVLPSIITGMFSYLLAKYTYNKNTPLDQMKITYNRLYYPIYIIITSDNVDIDSSVEKIKKYITKYKKYIDGSTLKAFNYLCKCDTIAKKKAAYQNFKNNIYNKNSFLRRRLGYLEPNFLQIYTYSSGSEKSTLRILIEFLFVYISFIFIGELKENSHTQLTFFIIFAFWFCVLTIEIVVKFVIYLYYKIRK